jgi:hypothetical protein
MTEERKPAPCADATMTRRPIRRPFTLCAILRVSVAFIGIGSWAGDAAASTYVLTDKFESYPTGVWNEGSAHGPWYVDFNGYGSVGIGGKTAGTKYHYQKPMVSTTPDETHASMVVSTNTFDGVDMTMRQRTVKQLRTGSKPNPWEEAWTVWGYSDDSHFYYFIFKPEGIELGKEHPGYPGAQRFLYTDTSPKMTIGTWNTIRVRQVNAAIDVWVNGVQVIRGFVDSPGPAGDQPYTEGKIGMYEEDAYVNFDNVRAQSTGASSPQ